MRPRSAPGTAANNTPPTLIWQNVNEDTLTVTFNGALDTSSVPAADAFEVKATRSGTERDVDLAATGAVAVAGSTVTLTLAEAVTRLDTVTVSYEAPGTNPLRDAGNAMLPVADFTDEPVENTTTDTTVPTLSSATANGATVTLTFSEALDESSVPPLARFAVARQSRRDPDTHRRRRQREDGNADPGRCDAPRPIGDGEVRQAHGGGRHAAAGPGGQRGWRLSGLTRSCR